MLLTSDDLEFVRAAAIAGACGVLSEMLCTPLEVSEVVGFRQGPFIDSLEEYLTVLELDSDADLAQIRATIHEGAAEDVASSLNIQATRLFSVSLDRVPAAPYESAWRDEGGALAGRPTMEVAEAYRLNGLMVDMGSGDLLPDHIARELEFLGHARRQHALALRAEDAASASHWTDVAERFRTRHLNSWVGDWADAVVAEGDSPFFCAVARIATAVTSLQ